VGAVLEDIQSQQKLTRARSEYLDAVTEYNKAQYALSQAVGGSWIAETRKPNGSVALVKESAPFGALTRHRGRW